MSRTVRVLMIAAALLLANCLGAASFGRAAAGSQNPPGRGHHDDQPAPARRKLSKVEVRFHTTEDDKDDDTLVDIVVKLPNSEIMAHVERIRGAFPINSDAGPFKLTIPMTITDNQIEGSTIVIKTTKSQGHDTWTFNFRIDFTFSEGAPILKQFPNLVLKENDPPKVIRL